MFVACFSRVLVAAVLLAAPAMATEPSADARRLYAEGKAEYAQGHYAQAVGLFERSYALSESPALLFNMAQAHRLAGPEHCSDAVALYKSYLAAQPDAENKKEVAERIAELGDCGAQNQPQNSATPAPPAPRVSASPPAPNAPPSPERRAQPAAPKPRSMLPTGPVLVTGTGTALLVAGGVLYARAWSKHREAERVCPCYPGTYSSWELLTNVSYALLAVGGATLAGGVSWWVVAAPGKNAEPAQAMLGVAGKF
jgi:tetratricopeptide (TPR) repeat protein